MDDALLSYCQAVARGGKSELAMNDDGLATVHPDTLRDLCAIALAGEGQPEYPAGTLEDALRGFRRPFAPAAVKWKVEAASEKWALVVPYIDARLVIERLNLVWPWWQADFDGPKGERKCGITLMLQEDGPAAITREDVGEGSFLKAANSDALKRAAVHWGIGVSIYALSKVDVYKQALEDDGHGDQFSWKSKGERKWSVTINASGRKRLRDYYEKWLRDRGEQQFGPMLDHGDEPDSVGDEAVPEAPEGAGETVAPARLLVDERADLLRGDCRNVYSELVKKPGARAKLPPARFKTELEEASVSHDALAAYLARLVEARDGDV